MKPTIHLPRVALRPASEHDHDRLCELLWLSEVRQFLCDGRILPPETISAMLARSADLDSQALGLWMIETSSGRLMGMAGLQPASEAAAAAHQSARDGIELLIALHPPPGDKALQHDAFTRSLVTHETPAAWSVSSPLLMSPTNARTVSCCAAVFPRWARDRAPRTPSFSMNVGLCGDAGPQR
jgi:hypothetical protein